MDEFCVPSAVVSPAIAAVFDATFVVRVPILIPCDAVVPWSDAMFEPWVPVSVWSAAMLLD